MATPDSLFRALFCHAFELHRAEFSVRNYDIKKAMYEIQDGYRAPKDSEEEKKVLDYNDSALRCAYLHKYAGFHAALTEHALLLIHNARPWILSEIFIRNEETKVCCLGGGPGNDVIGLSSAFFQMPESSGTLFNFTIVDKMHGWAYTYDTVLRAAESGRYEPLGQFLSNRISSSYCGGDIVSNIMVPVNAIRAADIVTMIKFMSAVKFDETPRMLERVFDWLKPGAVVLFIDNDAGGLHHTVSVAASKCNMETAFGPIRHYRYENEAFKKKLFDICSLSRTTVLFQMWKKPQPAPRGDRRGGRATSRPFQFAQLNKPRGRRDAFSNCYQRPEFAENGRHRERQDEPTSRRVHFRRHNVPDNLQRTYASRDGQQRTYDVEQYQVSVTRPWQLAHNSAYANRYDDNYESSPFSDDRYDDHEHSQFSDSTYDGRYDDYYEQSQLDAAWNGRYDDYHRPRFSGGSRYQRTRFDDSITPGRHDYHPYCRNNFQRVVRPHGYRRCHFTDRS